MNDIFVDKVEVELSVFVDTFVVSKNKGFLQI